MHEETIASRTAFEGRLLKVDVLEVETHEGVRAVREVVRHPGAVVVLIQRRDGRFVFVRQFRKAVEQTVLETPAGTLDAGEDPRTCAEREVLEETGHSVVELRDLGVIYPSPGYSAEQLHVFFATTGDEATDLQPDEDEHLEVVYLGREEIEQMIASGDMHDAKTLAAWCLLQGESGRP